jgi:hypothetical protein
MMDPISATLAVAQLLNSGLSIFAQARGGDPSRFDEIGKFIDAGMQVITQAQQVAGLIVKAHRENRDITDAELDEIAVGDDAARQILVDAIERAGATARPEAPGT